MDVFNHIRSISQLRSLLRQPLTVDIDPATGLMSVTELEQKLQQAERDGTLQKVVIPVHLRACCNMALSDR